MSDKCPNCGERDHDRLVWIDDQRVRCQRCQATFSPSAAQRLAAAPTAETLERDRALERIARETLMIETLETRGSDGLDFHDLPAWALRKALRRAFSAGYERAVEDYALPEDEAALGGDAAPARCVCPACGREIETRPIR